MRINSRFLEKDNNWQEESTTYWFVLSGYDDGTGRTFSDDIYGVVESCGDDSIVDCDGYPLVEGDWETIAVRRVAIVTEDMREK